MGGADAAIAAPAAAAAAAGQSTRSSTERARTGRAMTAAECAAGNYRGKLLRLRGMRSWQRHQRKACRSGSDHCAWWLCAVCRVGGRGHRGEPSNSQSAPSATTLCFCDCCTLEFLVKLIIVSAAYALLTQSNARTFASWVELL